MYYNNREARKGIGQSHLYLFRCSLLIACVPDCACRLSTSASLLASNKRFSTGTVVARVLPFELWVMTVAYSKESRWRWARKRKNLSEMPEPEVLPQSSFAQG